MTLFLCSGRAGNPNWHGFDYAINRVLPDGKGAVIEACEGGWSWRAVGIAELKTEGNQMMLRVPRSLIGANEGLINLQFKWADNYTEDDIWSFYEKGDAAPIGRLTYVFREAD